MGEVRRGPSGGGGDAARSARPRVLVTWPIAESALERLRERCEVEVLGAGEAANARRLRTANQDKGQATAIAEVLDAVRGGRPAPIPWSEIAAVSRTTFALARSMRSGERIALR